MQRRIHRPALMVLMLIVFSSGALHAQDDARLAELTRFEILQETIDVTSESSVVTVVAEVGHGSAPVHVLRVRFVSSSGETTFGGALNTDTGTEQEETWQGTFEVPQSVECGTWEALCTVELEDDAGNSVRISPFQLSALGFDFAVQVVSREDTTPPIITLNGPDEMTLECGVDTYTELGATVSDACCAEEPVTVSGDEVDTQETGTYIVKYDAVDCSGNRAVQATRTVNVVDVVRVNGPAEMILECGVDTYTELGATVSDACCAGEPITISGDEVDTHKTGTYVVKYDAVDCKGNPAIQATRTVRVVEIVTLNGPAEMTLECGIDVYVELGATARDSCCAGPVTISGAVDASTPGTYTVSYESEDCHGNAAIAAIRTVHVVDTTPPVITCPPDVWQDNDPGVCTATIDPGTATATDVCSVVVTGERSDGLALDDPYPIGITGILWLAADPSGNSSSCIQTVEVKDPEGIADGDTEPPVITCPTDVVTTCDRGCCGATVDPGKPTATDNCWATVRGRRSDGAALSSRYPVGSTTITWTASDPAGNSSTCAQVITVVDEEPPTITCPANLNFVFTDPGKCFATITDTTLGAPVTNDNCKVDTVTNDAPDQYQVGDTAVTWTVTDVHGNTATCAQTVTVVDKELPTIACPANIVVNNDARLCTARAAVPAIAASDNCGIAQIVNSFNNTADASDIYPVGTTTVTWTVTDIHGNISECDQEITVHDCDAPEIVCPDDIDVCNDLDECDAWVDIPAIQAGDNCGIAQIVNSFNNTADASDIYPVGTTTVTWTVTDIHGNTTECDQEITVHDCDAPEIVCPDDITVFNDVGMCGAWVNVPAVEARDNCGIVTIVNDYNDTADASDAYPVGTTIVTWTVTDTGGNVTQCIQTITVVDLEAPWIVLNGEKEITLEIGDRYEEQGAGVNDNCCFGDVIVGGDAVNTGRAGTYLVLYDAEDCNGNAAAQVVRTVHVVAERSAQGGVDIPAPPGTPAELCEAYQEMWEEHMQISPTITQAAERGSALWNSEDWDGALDAWEDELVAVGRVLEVSERILQTFGGISDDVMEALSGVVWYFSTVADDLYPSFLDQAAEAARLYNRATTDSQFKRADREADKAAAIRDEMHAIETEWVGQLEHAAELICAPCWDFQGSMSRLGPVTDQISQADIEGSRLLDEGDCCEAAFWLDESLDWQRQRHDLLIEFARQYSLDSELVGVFQQVVETSSQLLASYTRFVELAFEACEAYEAGDQGKGDALVGQAYYVAVDPLGGQIGRLLDMAWVLLCGD